MLVKSGLEKKIFWNKEGNKFAFVYHWFIACPPGLYGLNCSNKCSPNCVSCNRFNGTCEFGCKPGWKGLTCQNGSKRII